MFYVQLVEVKGGKITMNLQYDLNELCRLLDCLRIVSILGLCLYTKIHSSRRDFIPYLIDNM